MTCTRMKKDNLVGDVPWIRFIFISEKQFNIEGLLGKRFSYFSKFFYV